MDEGHDSLGLDSLPLSKQQKKVRCGRAGACSYALLWCWSGALCPAARASAPPSLMAPVVGSLQTVGDRHCWRPPSRWWQPSLVAAMWAGLHQRCLLEQR